MPASSIRRIALTGIAGFIGFHTTRALAAQGFEVLGMDNLNAYYDVELKHARLDILRQEHHNTCHFEKIDLGERDRLMALIKDFKADAIVNLAAQAGVRYSLEHPEAYAHSNLTGFQNILDAARRAEVQHLLFASTSSVYGANTTMPFSTHQSTEHPLTIYAATKKANEVMAHSYAAMHSLPCTGLRFFTAYGPWGRPDMSMFIFTKAILAGEPIPVFNHGNMERDFTYVTDIAETICRLIPVIPTASEAWDSDHPDPSYSCYPFKLYNIGNGQPEALMTMISLLEECLGRPAQKNFLPMQIGDISRTAADIAEVVGVTGYRPQVGLREGVRRFVDWYRTFYGESDDSSARIS